MALPQTGAIGYDGVMRLSARNQLPGTIVEIHEGAVTTTVKVRLEGGSTMTSSITKEAADELGLAVDAAVVVVVKASDVMIAVE
jgi:molybdopterin-binding protein